MFVEVTDKERKSFLYQSDGCHIPGYTGHCPTLKFRFGKRYGANTKEIIQELGAKAPPRRHEPYRPHDNRALLTPIVRSQGQTKDLALDIKNKSRRYVLGYTGYMPGINFRYGTSFKRAADESDLEFRVRASDEERRRVRERHQVVYTTPIKMKSLRSKDEVARALQQYKENIKYKGYNDHHISAEFPPIAGYTGHIPRLQGTMSQRYFTAVKQGLGALQREREQRYQLPMAYDAVRAVLDAAEHDINYTTPAM